MKKTIVIVAVLALLCVALAACANQTPGVMATPNRSAANPNVVTPDLLPRVNTTGGMNGLPAVTPTIRPRSFSGNVTPGTGLAPRTGTNTIPRNSTGTVPRNSTGTTPRTGTNTTPRTGTGTTPRTGTGSTSGATVNPNSGLATSAAPRTGTGTTPKTRATPIR